MSICRGARPLFLTIETKCSSFDLLFGAPPFVGHGYLTDSVFPRRRSNFLKIETAASATWCQISGCLIPTKRPDRVESGYTLVKAQSVPDPAQYEADILNLGHN